MVTDDMMTERMWGSRGRDRVRRSAAV